MDTHIPTTEFDIAVDAENTTNTDAEAALEALRAAIGGTSSSSDLYNHTASSLAAPGHGLTVHQEDARTASPTLDSAAENGATSQTQHLTSLVSSLSQLSGSNATILDQLSASTLSPDARLSVDLLVKSNKKQADIIKNLNYSLATASNLSSIDPVLTGNYVSRSEYDDLKTRYDLVIAAGSTTGKARASGSSRKPRASRATVAMTEAGDDVDSPLSAGASDERPGGGTRKRRSIKLEHLIHKMANRRLGVEYNIANFESKGSKDLPAPDTIPPTADESINAVDEMRPDYTLDANHPDVKTFIDTVVEDVAEAWEGGVALDEPEADKSKIRDSVKVYWGRICKRWEEQQARDRGEVHKDELVRRRQNQYRRQQSLLARRIAAFNASPLNVCKLRALYRTLLVIDFAPPTNERPDPTREYTADEWHAYQRLANGGRAPHAHEVVDQFWWSPTVRSLLQILDVFAVDQMNRSKKKGKPKAPSPTFHLPTELWDRSNLPRIRPKRDDGLPIAGQPGIVLFRFQVDEEVIRLHPTWAKDLYDNPPVPEEDVVLPNLADVMEASVFAHLRPVVKALRDSAIVPQITPEEVERLNSQPAVTDDVLPESKIQDAYSLLQAASHSTDAQADADKSLDAMLDISNATYIASSSPFISLPSTDAATALPSGPSLGSSVRARRQAKRLASELPGGAATPVAKRSKKEGVSDIAEQIVERQVEEGIKGDTAFLDAL